MKGYTIDHKNFKFEIDFPASVLPAESYLISRTKVDSLYANIVIRKKNVKNHEIFIKKLVKINNTPHYQFICGNKQPYIDYLNKFGKAVGFGIEHSPEAFEQLINTKELYLSGEYERKYIICQKKNTLFGSKNIILDGVHRAAILYANGVKEIPVVFIKNNKKEVDQFKQYLHDYKNEFLEWYTPLEINGEIIHERTYPNFKERPEYLTNKERGQSKWDFIIAPNLPNLTNKKICDIGCNIGLYSLLISKLGAAKVVGYDRAENVIQPTNPNLPKQNVVQQAYFVKNLFKLANKGNFDNIEYIDCDINDLDFSSLKYDLLFSSCVLYHFGKEKFEKFISQISDNIPEIFLQTNLGHSGELAETASIEYQRKILERYNYQVKIDAPKDYKYPIIYAWKIL